MKNVDLYDEEFNKVFSLARGSKVKVNDKKEITNEDNTYLLVKYDNKEYYVLKENIVNDKKDAVMEKELYVRTAATILGDLDGKIAGLAEKGTLLKIKGYDSYDDKGIVNAYLVTIESG